MLATLISAIPFAAAEGGSEESGGGTFLVKPEIAPMLFTFIAFGVALFILSKYAFPKIGEALDRRQKAIEDSIEHAEHTRVEADALLAEYRERLKEARAQADEIVARARKSGEEHERASLDEARKMREEMLEQTKKDVQAETQRAIQEIRREVADLTIQATEKVTRKSLTGDDQRRLVDEALGELDFTALSGDNRQN